MNIWKNIWKPWNSQSITVKFSLAVAVLLFLLFLIAAVSIGALLFTRHATEDTIFISTHIQHKLYDIHISTNCSIYHRIIIIISSRI